MTEIEMKAHVENPEDTEKKIRGFAQFSGESQKSDVYWKRGCAEGERDTTKTIASDAMVVTAAATTFGTMAIAVLAAVFAFAGAGKLMIIFLCLGATILSSIAAILAGVRGGTKKEYGPRVNVRIREEKKFGEDTGVTVVTYKRKEMQGSIEVNDEKEFSTDNREDFEVLLSDLDFSPAITKEKKTKSFLYTANDGTHVTIELSLVTSLGYFVELEILSEKPDEAEIARTRETLASTLRLCGIGTEAIETRYYTELLSSARDFQDPKK